MKRPNKWKARRSRRVTYGDARKYVVNSRKTKIFGVMMTNHVD